MSPQPPQRLEKILARVAREQGLDQERLRRWVSFLALCGALEQGIERVGIDTWRRSDGTPFRPLPPGLLKISISGLSAIGQNVSANSKRS